MSKLKQLTPREKQILRLTLADYKTKEICHFLDLHPNTVNEHRKRGMKKLEVDTLLGLVRVALKESLINLEDLMEE